MVHDRSTYRRSVAYAAIGLATSIFSGAGCATAPAPRPVGQKDTHTNCHACNNKADQVSSPNVMAAVLGNVGRFLSNPAAVEASATVLLTAITALLAYVARQQYTTTRTQLRAYMFIEDAKITITEAVAPKWRCEYRFKNAGNTPAHQVRVNAIAAVAGWPPDKLPKPVDDEYFGSMFPSPSDFMDAETDAIATTTEENWSITSKDATKAIFLVGRINYMDVFNRRQHTDFCFYWTGPVSPNQAMQMSAYDQGNDAT